VFNVALRTGDRARRGGFGAMKVKLILPALTEAEARSD
jgi:hypothetical protein